VWVTELAGRFWASAGPPPPFPRDLTAAATAALSLRVARLPGLRLGGVRAWLARNRVACPADETDRPLRACLVTRAGFGFVFLDADDPAEELRFSLAHEVAHFLRDYDALRRAAVARLGPATLEVFDGKRPATAEERLHAVFRGVPVAAHVHLLRRDHSGRPRTEAEREAEAAADSLAFELLAPAELFTGFADAGAIQARLEAEFGLPATAAAAYAAALRPPEPPTDPFVERLRKSG
jgi:hypothetical protein